MSSKNQKILFLSAFIIIASTGVLLGALNYVVEKISDSGPSSTKRVAREPKSTDDMVKLETRPVVQKKPAFEMPRPGNAAMPPRGFDPRMPMQGGPPNHMQMPSPEMLRKMRQGGPPMGGNGMPSMPPRGMEGFNGRNQQPPSGSMPPMSPQQGAGQQQTWPSMPMTPPYMPEGGGRDDSFQHPDYYPPPYWPEEDYLDEEYYPGWQGKNEEIKPGIEARKIADGIDYAAQYEEEDPDSGFEDEYLFETED